MKGQCLIMKENKKHSGVYKIENLVNGKVYIGKSESNIEERFKEHLRSLRKLKHHNEHLQKAFNKYGEDKFKLTILEEIQNRDELNEKEKYWIAYYNANNIEYGYNLTVGGDGGSPSEEVRKRISETMKKHIRTSEHCENISKSLKAIGHCVPYNHSKGKIIVQTDIDNKFIAEYKSIAEASKITGVSKISISKSCKKQYISYKQYRWFYLNDYKNLDNFSNKVIKPIISKSGKRFIQWDNKNKKWVIMIYIDKKFKNIGRFSNLEEAVVYRNSYILKNNLNIDLDFILESEQIIQ